MPNHWKLIESRKMLMVCSLIWVLFTLTGCAEIGKYFTRSPQSIVAPPGDQVSFQCETNIPGEQVRWKLNGRFLEPKKEPGIKVVGAFLYVKVGSYSEEYLNQIGEYQCVVSFGAEAMTSVPAQLTIPKLEEFVQKESKTLEVVERSTVAIDCDPPYSHPDPVIQFFKNDNLIESVPGHSQVMDSGVLHINNVSVADQGTYYCTATNHVTSNTYTAKSTTRLIVRGKSEMRPQAPRFLIKPHPYYAVPKDGNISLECVTTGNPPPYTTWRKLRASSVNNLHTSKGILHLYNFGMEQEGEYICEAYNGVGDSLTTLSTVVVNSMPNITEEPLSLVVEEGGEASFTCKTSGLPKPRVYWIFNGESVHNGGNIEIYDGGLRIRKVEKKHAGLFQCFANNPMGTVSSPAELKVMPQQITALPRDADFESQSVHPTPPVRLRHHHHHGHTERRRKHKRRKFKNQDMVPPSRPSVNRVSEKSVMLRWEVPRNDGYPIKFFKVQFKQVSKRRSKWMTLDEDIPPHIHSFEVPTLETGQAYKFRIAAVYSNNDNTVGKKSKKFILKEKVEKGAPHFVPVIMEVYSLNDTTLNLMWKVPQKEINDLEGYFIYYREATTAEKYSKVSVIGKESNSHHIGHLKAGTAYDIKIQSFNDNGVSNFSSIYAARTSGLSDAAREEQDEYDDPDGNIFMSPEEEVDNSDQLYIILGGIFIAFWLILCLACALCYKCKQKKAEKEAKYSAGDLGIDVEGKAISNGHAGLNGLSPLNGFITQRLDEKETSFVDPIHNNNRPISPSLLNSPDGEFTSYKSMTLEHTSVTELRTMSIRRNEGPMHDYRSNYNHHDHHSGTNEESVSRNSSLKNHQKHHHMNTNQSKGPGSLNGSLRNKLPYVPCNSNDGMEFEDDSKSPNKVFPKEHYKMSWKKNRKRNLSNGTISDDPYLGVAAN